MTVARQLPPLAFERVEDVEDALRQHGHRVSAPARLVLSALFGADGPISGEQIASGLGGRQAPLDPTSVYRNLERLERLGAVTHLHAGHGPGLYALARDGDREYLVCERCGAATAVDPAELDAVREIVQQRFGLHARFSHFPIHGLCANCAPPIARRLQ